MKRSIIVFLLQSPDVVTNDLFRLPTYHIKVLDNVLYNFVPSIQPWGLA